MARDLKTSPYQILLAELDAISVAAAPLVKEFIVASLLE
jgi:hypothetical protein